MKPIVVTAVLLAAVVCPASSETITVDTNGGGDFTGIAAAVDAAAEGDTVLVLPGYYGGPQNSTIDFDGKDLVLMSRDGCETTTINGYMFDNVLLLQNGESREAVVRGLTITMTSYLALVLTDSSPTISECRFTENFTSQGDPLSAQVCAVGYAANGSPLVEDCVFDRNEAGARISTMHFVDCDVTLRGCSFTLNEEHGNYIYGGPTGTLAFSGTSHVVMEDCVFEDNLSETCCLSVHDDADVSIIDCTFAGNTPVADTSQEGLLHFANSGSVEISGCTFAKNTNAGSCVSVSGPTAVEIADCTLVGNDGAAGQVINVVSGSGGTISILRSILALNESCVVPIACDAALPTLTSCCFYETGDPALMCEDYDPETLLFDDPRFCDYQGDDYTLCLNSPCLVPNNGWSVQIGAHGWGCDDCDAALEPSSWGSIKSLFR
jgi:hypothetical protein